MLIVFYLLLCATFMALAVMPQAVFGMLIAFRARGPIHTDECGFPLFA